MDCPIHSSQQISMSVRLREETSQILEDFLQHHLDGGHQPSPSPAAQTLRRVAGEMLDKNRSFFDSCSQISGNPKDVLQTVAATLIEDGGLNWGRIVSLIMFAGVLVKRSKDQRTATPKELAEVLSQFLAEEQRDWLQSNGGWNGFHKYFSNKGTLPGQDNNAISGALVAVAGFGLAGLAFLLAVR
ncbi:bcl-2 10 [Pelobates cultripes]|uniref:Bcl-2 10 n=1 Tax=Pelobates cultripes TaxID=61616 RepID=A0AAD1RLC5_PELCU|nr:bcl-2 10 [Pelobates cultripes]